MRKFIYIFIITLALTLASHSQADSKRIFVYQLPQPYWYVQEGDSLSKIAATLLPNKPEQQQSLMQSIIDINPNAFINQDPDRLHSDIRLLLPANNIQTHDVQPNTGNTKTTEYSWGSIKKEMQ